MGLSPNVGSTPLDSFDRPTSIDRTGSLNDFDGKGVNSGLEVLHLSATSTKLIGLVEVIRITHRDQICPNLRAG